MRVLKLYFALAVWMSLTAVSAQGVDAPAGAIADTFDGPNLDQTLWTLVNPRADSQLRMTAEGVLALSVPAGVTHDAWGDNMAPRIMQPVADTDFTLEVKFDSEPTMRFQGQGLIIEQSPDRWLRFELHHDGRMLKAFGGIGSARSARFDSEIASSNAHYLRVQRRGITWIMLHSPDRETWTETGRFDFPMVANFAGIHVTNAGPAPAFTALIDHFHVIDAPPAPWYRRPHTDGPPLVHAVQANESNTDLQVRWFTDEPASAAVTYGLTPDLEAGRVVEPGAAMTHAHRITLPDFTPGQVIYYQVESADASGQRTTSDVQSLVFDPQGPQINVWYGDEQQFGQHGSPQHYVNIPGNVSDEDGVASLVYILNGDADEAVTLSMGPDDRRLARRGDFNIDLSTDLLITGDYGVNTVEIIARDSYDNTSTTTVTVLYQPTEQPLPYTVDWAALASDAEIQDVAHVIDGHWTLDAGRIRTLEPGYDRLVGIGDAAWQDYEATVPVIIHSAMTQGSVGLVLRWTGHTDRGASCPQPRCGYLPLGTIAFYNMWQSRLELFGDDVTLDLTLESETAYVFKAQVETIGDTTEYRFKVWPEGDPEPDDWLVTATDPADEMPRGSLLLISHWLDVSFGPVTISPLPD